MPMSTDTHVEALKDKHNAIKKAIHQEAVRPYPDENTINTLKKQKLLLKDEIQRATLN
jgi:hypothetical protein